MKFLIPLLFLCGIANAQEYKRLHRTYLDLSAIDLSECEGRYRFVNENWMDCQMMLPLPGPKLSQITPAHFEFQRFTFPSDVPGYDFSVDVRYSAHDWLDGSLGTNLIVSAYYKEPGKPAYIHKMPPEKYSWPVFQQLVRQAFLQMTMDHSWRTQDPMIALPSQDPKVQDHILDSVHVIKRKFKLDLAACKKTFIAEEIDGWPNDNYWLSGCRVSLTVHPRAEPLPLTGDFQAPGLRQKHPYTIAVGRVELSYSAWGYSLSTDGNLTWEEVEADFLKAMEAVGIDVEYNYILDARYLSQIYGQDTNQGKLILKDGLLDIKAER